jgi:AraC-like DNA-binding protein
LPPFERLADKMHISPQTLRRRLGEDGTSYRNIKDILRRDYCIEKLTRTTLPIAEIATQIGFSEPAVLTRAFNNWTGMSPSGYRELYAIR